VENTAVRPSRPVRGRLTNRLSDRAIRAFLAQARAGKAATKKLSDGGGLFLTLTPAGSAVWRMKYRHAGKEKIYSVGVYPTVGLAVARSARETARAHLRDGRDPTTARALDRVATTAAAADTFADVAESWLAKQKSEWSEIHYRQSKRALERDVFPALGRLPVSEITSPMIAHVVEKVANRGAVETAGKVLWNVQRVFHLAKTRGLCKENPAIGVREVLPKAKPNGQRPALLTFETLGDLLRRFEAAPISPPVRIAHRLIAFTASRIGNAITAEWDEFDLDSDLPSWTVPRRKMKMRDRKHDHRALLGPTIAAELRTWRSVTGGRGFVFPSPTGRATITHEALEKVLRVTLGFADRHSVHGWRASFSTLARDHGFSKEVVELALDHVTDTATVRAYDRGQRLGERKKLAAWWDAELSSAQLGAKVIPLRPAGVA
jgi:integrase